MKSSGAPLRRLHRPVMVVLSAAMLLSVASPAYADDIIDPNDKAAVAARQAAVTQQLQVVTGTVDSMTTEVAAAYTQLNKTETQIPVARANLENAQRDLADAQEKDRLTGLRLTAAEAEEKKLVGDVQTSQAQSAEAKSAVGRIAVDAYMGTSANASLDLVFDSTSAQDYAESSALYDIAVQNTSNQANALGAQTSLQQNSSARLTAVRAQVAELKKQAETNVTAMQAAQKSAQDAKTALDSLYTAQKSQTALLEQQKQAELGQQATLTLEKSQLDAQLAALVEQEKQAATLLAQSQGQAAPTFAANPAVVTASNPQGSWGLTIPVSAPVTSEFSSGRVHPIYGVTRAHEGIDLGAACNTPIKAARAGTITESSYQGGGGNVVGINHGVVNGTVLFTRYLHLNGFAPGISVGAQVQAGQIVGYVGSTGGSTGCHLHWEIRPNGQAQNPRNFVTF
ncbi:peptidoglycan DD-metalloendopeptidase family protein [Micrococcales bacterium 31B]|nr:peptidoglycan DD-metalloendopeptidase family protein [Micrococcales bacterium 31B]